MPAGVATLLGALCLACALGIPSLTPRTIAAPAEPLPGTAALERTGDLSAEMVAGIDRSLMRALDAAVSGRASRWQRDPSDPAAYERSVASNREHLRRWLGVVDERLPVEALEYVGTSLVSSRVAENAAFAAYAVRWPVLEGVRGEGLLLQPRKPNGTAVVVLPDADQTPEMLVGLAPGVPPDSQMARRLAEAGCVVVVPVLIDRSDTHSGNPALGRFTNQPHREWIYRQAYQMGRHILGYEVQKVLALVDWMSTPAPKIAGRIAVAGYGEGGLIALYAAALDPRVRATLVSGAFGSREHTWSEPIYRNVWSLLTEFGDAELASLIAPRILVVEHSAFPTVDGPPKPRQGRSGAAPGALRTPAGTDIEAEVQRARSLAPKAAGGRETVLWVHGPDRAPLPFGATPSLEQLVGALGVPTPMIPVGLEPPADLRRGFVPDERQRRQVRELEDFTQRLLRTSERTRTAMLQAPAKGATQDDWHARSQPLRDRLWGQVLGRMRDPDQPVNAKSRLILDEPKWRGYDVTLDVWEDVFAWGVLLLPKDLKPGERRPVVVCQHGLEGVPMDTIHGAGKSGYEAYKSYSARLADEGYVVFAPHNPYRGQDRFRVLQRKANPLGLSLFSYIIGQHQRILEWLAAQPFIDPQRMAFYGLSYGGKTAMRVPAVLDRYCLSICSADFNEWNWKNATVDSPYSYLFTGEYEMPEFNLGFTFNYAEMAALIAPRPFMVERGHHDGVAPDEQVAYEYAKVRRFYTQLGIPGRTTIEFFNGPHTINGVGTFEFLRQHLQPRP